MKNDNLNIPQSAIRNPHSEGPRSKIVKVLLIEDNQGDVRLTREMLAEARAGTFDPECADRFSTGIERLAQGGIDVVLLDLGLPDGQGLDTLTRAQAHSPQVPIIVLTGFDDETRGVEAVRRGAQDYLVKGQVDSNLLGRTVQYAIERKQAEMRIKHLNSVLRAIRNVNQLIVVEKDRDNLLQRACDALVEARGYEAAWLGFLTDGKTFATVKGCGFTEDVYRFCSHVLAGDHPLCVKDGLTQKDSIVIMEKSVVCGDCFFKNACSGKERAIIRVERSGRLLGLLAILLSCDVAADEDEKALLKEVAGDIGFALRNMELEETRERTEEELRQSFHRLRRILEGTINALASTVETRDPYTAGHQQRVALLACDIGKEMGLSDDMISGIHMAALIHDIGKIAVPAQILSKPGRLTGAEFDMIKAHSEVGYDILKGIEFPHPIAQVVLQHHERINGSGYPQGLKGEDILPGARIVAVADVVEAISSHRPYRPALGIDKALEEISENRDILYEPMAVDACLKLVKEKGFGFE